MKTDVSDAPYIPSQYAVISAPDFHGLEVFSVYFAISYAFLFQKSI